MRHGCFRDPPPTATAGTAGSASLRGGAVRGAGAWPRAGQSGERRQGEEMRSPPPGR